MQKYLIEILIFLFTVLLAVLIWGGVTNWKFLPTKPSNSSTKLTTNNVCNPSRGCNVCSACCQSYIPEGDACDGCVAQNCNPCKPDSNSKCGPNVCSYCCNEFIGQSECGSCIIKRCEACSKNGTMGGDGKCVCDQEYETCGNYSQKQSDCVAQSDKFGNKICQYNSDNTCTSKTTWMGPTCQYSRETTCNSRGNVDDNGVCKCDSGYAGKNCEYSRKDCNNHGNPYLDGKKLSCKCDTGWNGATCTGIAKVSDQGFSNPGVSGGGTCTSVWICPWAGVSLSAPTMTHGLWDGFDNTGNWKNCIHVEDHPGKGPDITFKATGANGKTDTYHVQKDCCGFQAGLCWRSNTQPLSISGGTNYAEWSANGTTAGGMIIGMPL